VSETKLERGRTVYLVVRDDEPGHGEWFVKAREASLKATWLREGWKARVRVVKAVIDEDPPPSTGAGASGSFPRASRRP
jgi:hypothetical protein